MCDTGEFGGWFSGLPVWRPGTVSSRLEHEPFFCFVRHEHTAFPMRSRVVATIASLDVEVERLGSGFGPRAFASCCAYDTADVTAVHICRLGCAREGRDDTVHYEACPRGATWYRAVQITLDGFLRRGRDRSWANRRRKQ
jgi:hypothetical protein